MTTEVPWAGSGDSSPPIGGGSAPGERPRILVATGTFPPAYRSGGPPRTMQNLVRLLGVRFSFAVVTGSVDLGSREPLAGVEPDRWTTKAGARVYYASPGQPAANRWRQLLEETPHDLLYLNGVFSYRFAILPLVLMRLGRVPRRPVVIAPRGQLADAAIALSPVRKRLFLSGAMRIGIFDSATWHATSDHEVDDIRRTVADSRIVVAANPFSPAPKAQSLNHPAKEPGEAHLLYLGRVAPNKNLAFALRVLCSELRGRVVLTIVGHIDDSRYWRDCQQLISKLPGNVRVRVRGPVDHRHVSEILQEHHLLFLPTQGENFGHAILEALQHGCPALISDRTPWRDLGATGAGWDLPLESISPFAASLQDVLDADGAAHLRMRFAAREYALRFEGGSDIRNDYIRLFEGALDRGTEAS